MDEPTELPVGRTAKQMERNGAEIIRRALFSLDKITNICVVQDPSSIHAHNFHVTIGSYDYMVEVHFEDPS